MPDNDASQPEFRRARVDDTAIIVGLWKEMMWIHNRLDPRFQPTRAGERFISEDLRNWINDRDYGVFVAETKSVVVGYLVAAVRVNPRVVEPRLLGYITDICVKKSERRKGIGARLVEEAKSWFLGRGLQVVLLRAAARNPDARVFWEAMGWTDFMHEMWSELGT